MGPKKAYFQVIDGVQRCPNLTVAVFSESLTFRACPGDVLLSSYPMAGGKWVNCIIQLILNHGQPIATFEEFARGVRSLVKSPLPMRLFSTGMPPQQDTMNSGSMYVCVVRNPWDSCVSLYRMVADMSNYRFQDGTFHEFFDSFLEDSFGFQTYLDVVAEGFALKDLPNVLFATYEDLQKDAETVVLGLARFLDERYAVGWEGNASLLGIILELSSALRMKDVTVATMRRKADRIAVSSKAGYRGDKSSEA
ncbi:sulfotransferase 1C4-like [Haemaphysalis longicornis]